MPITNLEIRALVISLKNQPFFKDKEFINKLIEICRIFSAQKVILLQDTPV